mmetsp:Transcript_30262/g.75677  ORF Transcript_30262/g.75677 Transcript_30262/m.75677 type:complete len:350 (-) Transcript_30262:93-1142(-)|eukprot:jgi/Tetstr1/431300/TSEL_020993.t1
MAGAAAAAAAFTPLEATIGGATLGVATANRMTIVGRILGHSGILRGLVQGDHSPWRYVFLGGMAAGSIVATNMIPGALVPLPDSFPVSRAIAAGLLVGVGSSMGNGCTSGHGICGNSRLSPRSMVYTGTFMAAGAVSASISGVTSALGIAGLPTSLAVSVPPPDVLMQGLVVLLGSVLVGLASWFAGSKLSGTANKAVGLATEATSGALFAWGLAYAGMTKSTKVASFLAVTDKCFDPTLMFVMAGAILVNLPVFQAIIRKKVFPAKPVCALEYQMPKSSAIDPKLLLGGVLFGTGWGVGGLCPGPAICNLAANPLSPLYIAFMASMLAGFALESSSFGQAIWKKPAQA